MPRRPRRPWSPRPDWPGLPPGVSGNAINGLGEAEPRRPRQVFWQAGWLKPGAPHPLAPLLAAVVARFDSVGAYHDAYANADRGPRTPPVPGPKVERSAAEWTRRVKDFALARPGARPDGYPAAGSEAECVGIARIDPGWVYEEAESDYPFVIVLGIAMDHARLSKVPSSADDPEGQLEVCDQYNRGARAASWLAHWIRTQGWRARPHCGPWVGALDLLPAAIACGFGELGKHGSLIHREFGSSFRLAAVETDLPLEPDAPDRFGADDFCARCQVCTQACPPQAIAPHKQLVRGVVKWYVDFDKCIAYFDETYGCAICIAVCPWSTPGRAPRLAQFWGERSSAPARHGGHDGPAGAATIAPDATAGSEP